MKLYILQYLLLGSALFQMPKTVSAQSSATDYFRSAGSGAWSVAGSWESSPNGSSNWISSTLVPTSAANTVTVRSGHTITISGNTTVDQVVVASGGILELTTAASIQLTVNDATGNDLIIQAGGVFKHNIAAGSQLPAFISSATIEIQTGGTLEVANNNGVPSDYAVTTSAVSSHIIWGDGSVFNWNATSSPTDGVTYFPAGVSIPVFRFSRAASFGNTVPTVINGLLEANAVVSFQSTGTKTIRNGITGTASVAATAASGGQFIINGATAKLGGGTLTLPNTGMLISAGTTVTLTSNKTINKVSSISPVTLSGTLVCDDYIIDGDCKIQIDGTLKTSNVNGLTGASNTTFATGFTVNTLGATSTIEYNRAGDQVVTPLAYSNLNVSGSGSKNTGAADVLVSGTLDIAAENTFTLNGTNNLKLNGGGIININTNGTFDNGGESQVSGTNTPVINISGTFITRDADGFTGTNTSIPGATSVSPTITVNINAGSTIEYGRVGDQQVTSRNDYRNVTFSGSGTKTLATFIPNGTVTIKDNAIADASNKTFGDATTNLNMTGGRFKVAGSSTKPDIAGTYNLSGGVIEFAGGTSASRQNIRSTPTYLNIEITGVNTGNSNSSTRLANGGTFTVKTGGSYENSGDKIDGTTGIQTFVMETGATFKTGVTGGFSGTAAGTLSPALNSIETITVHPKSTIIYSKSGDQTITQLPGSYPTLLLKGTGIKTVATGTVTVAAASDSIVIDPLVVCKVNSGAVLNCNGCHLYVRSSASGTGSIGEITDGASGLLNATNITAERYIPARRAFRLLASPVTTPGSIKANWMEGQSNPAPAYSVNNNNNSGYGTHITGSSIVANGFDATATNNPSLFTFDNSSQVWSALPNTGSLLKAGFGYRLLVRGSRSVDLSNNAATPSNTILRTTGSLQAGTVVYNSSSTPSLSATVNSYSLAGNPYACSVDWDALQKTGLSSYYYVWDPNLNTRGAYVAYGNGITSNAGSQVDQNIQSGQAFFVQTKAANPSLTFNEVNKTTVNKNVFRTSSNAAKLAVQLLLDTTGEVAAVADGVTVVFDDDSTGSSGVESAGKISNPDETMSVSSNGIDMSIETQRPVIASDSLQLHITQFRQKNYFLRIEAINFPASITAFVKDNYAKTETAVNLFSSALFPFSITDDSASFNPNRFAILLRSAQVLPMTFINVNASKKETGIQVAWTVVTESGIERYEVERSGNGQQFEKLGDVIATNDRNATKSYSWYDANILYGTNFYRIKCIEKSGTVKYSRQVSLYTSADKSTVVVFPNPVKGNDMNIWMNNMVRGRYAISVVNNMGQKIFTAIIYHNGTGKKYSITTGKVISKASYVLQVSNGDETFSENILFD